MHVEVNVALNFLVSYLYNKLPRRRVDLFREELEKGLKEKFEGHWYPDKPFKGSGYRCVRCNGEKVDPVILVAARSAGLDLLEVKEHIPQEMTLWIDPSEVSYRLSERSPIKVLYSEEEDEEACGNVDQEVQVANHHTFNPEASSFQPIDTLSSSLASADFHLSLCASPVSSSMWSSSTMMPPSSLFSQTLHSSPPAPLTMQQCSPVPQFMSKTSCAAAPPQFTAASFAATKFGSTKLKSQAKRPTRLSPTEMGNFFRQQQRLGFNHMGPAPQRPRSLSPRDPRVEFMMDQQQRFNPSGQVSPQAQQGFGHTLNQHHLVFPPSPLSPDASIAADLMLRHSPPNLPTHMGAAVTTFPEMLSPGSRSTGSLSSIQSPVSSLSPEGHRSFMEDLQQLHNMHSFPGHLQHLLVAN